MYLDFLSEIDDHCKLRKIGDTINFFDHQDYFKASRVTDGKNKSSNLPAEMLWTLTEQEDGE